MMRTNHLIATAMGFKAVRSAHVEFTTMVFVCPPKIKPMLMSFNRFDGLPNGKKTEEEEETNKCPYLRCNQSDFTIFLPFHFIQPRTVSARALKRMINAMKTAARTIFAVAHFLCAI